MLSSWFARQEIDRVERQLLRITDTDLEQLTVIARTQFWCARGIVNNHLGRYTKAYSDLNRVLELEGLIGQHDTTTMGGGDVKVVARASWCVRTTFGAFMTRPWT